MAAPRRGRGGRPVAALEPDDVVLGGGNVKKLKELPPGCRAGDNANAFLGGVRLWEDEAAPRLVRERSGEAGKESRHDHRNRATHRTAGLESPRRPITRRSGTSISGLSSRTTPSAASG